MSSRGSFLVIRRYCISCVLLLSLILSGCNYGRIGDAIVLAIVERPILISAAAASYYHEFGRWPSSACDLEELAGEDFPGIDWASLEDTIVFEELPDGRLKIISTDPHYRFTLTTDVPPDQQGNENSQKTLRISGSVLAGQ
jgi:hypothetical protein